MPAWSTCLFPPTSGESQTEEGRRPAPQRRGPGFLGGWRAVHPPSSEFGRVRIGVLALEAARKCSVLPKPGRQSGRAERANAKPRLRSRIPSVTVQRSALRGGGPINQRPETYSDAGLSQCSAVLLSASRPAGRDRNRMRHRPRRGRAGGARRRAVREHPNHSRAMPRGRRTEPMEPRAGRVRHDCASPQFAARYGRSGVAHGLRAPMASGHRAATGTAPRDSRAGRIVPASRALLAARRDRGGTRRLVARARARSEFDRTRKPRRGAFLRLVVRGGFCFYVSLCYRARFQRGDGGIAARLERVARAAPPVVATPETALWRVGNCRPDPPEKGGWRKPVRAGRIVRRKAGGEWQSRSTGTATGSAD